jgi:hypothetical protein
MVESSVAKATWKQRRSFFLGPAPSTPTPVMGPGFACSKLAPATNLPG